MSILVPVAIVSLTTMIYNFICKTKLWDDDFLDYENHANHYGDDTDGVSDHSSGSSSRKSYEIMNKIREDLYMHIYYIWKYDTMI